MDGVELTLRQTRNLGKVAARRVENDLVTVREKLKTFLDRWGVIKLMDFFWTERASDTTGEWSSGRTWKPYLIAVTWLWFLLTLFLTYYVDVSSTESLFVTVVVIRIGRIICFLIFTICLTCCFEYGQNILLGGLFLLSVLWFRPPKKRPNSS